LSAQSNEENALREKARLGWIWGGLDQFVQRGLGMVVSLLLARLLEPAAFGLIASVSIFIAIIQQLIDGGLSQRVLQKPIVRNADYVAFFWCNIVVTLTSCALLMTGAGHIAQFFGNPELREIVIALSLIVLVFNGARVHGVILTRDMRFRAISAVTMVSVVAGCVVGLGMAVAGYGVWALVGQQMAAALTRTAGFWILAPWRPRSLPAWVDIKDLYAYGVPVMMSEVARTFSDQLINVLIAKRISPVQLGYFDRGRIIPSNIALSLANVFARTNFPVLSRLQHDDDQFRSTYLNLLSVSSAAYLMLMAGLAVSAADLILIVLGEKWSPSTWYLRANCMAFALYMVFLSNGQVLRAKGSTRLYFRCNIMLAAFQVVGIVAGIPWGAKGMVFGDMAARGLAGLPMMLAVKSVSGISIRMQLGAMARPLLGSLAVIGVLLSLQLAVPSLYPRFFLSGIAGAALLSLYWRWQLPGREKV
jgi:teichuronic acid exporter